MIIDRLADSIGILRDGSLDLHTWLELFTAGGLLGIVDDVPGFLTSIMRPPDGSRELESRGICPSSFSFGLGTASLCGSRRPRALGAHAPLEVSR